MTAIAATMISPAISAYSITSPPRSSRRNVLLKFLMASSLAVRHARSLPPHARARRNFGTSRTASSLQGAVQRRPAGQHLRADGADDGDGGHDDQAGDQGVLE